MYHLSDDVMFEGDLLVLFIPHSVFLVCCALWTESIVVCMNCCWQMSYIF